MDKLPEAQEFLQEAKRLLESKLAELPGNQRWIKEIYQELESISQAEGSKVQMRK